MQRDLPVEMSLQGNVRKRKSTMWAKLQRVWVGWGGDRAVSRERGGLARRWREGEGTFFVVMCTSLEHRSQAHQRGL